MRQIKAVTTIQISRKNVLPPSLVQIPFAFLGALATVLAYSDLQFNRIQGTINGAFCLPLSIGVAFFTLAFLSVTRWRSFSIWFSFALVGQAIALQMIDAGPTVRYQHYESVSEILTGPQSFRLFFLAAQAILVAAALRPHWSKIQAWLHQCFKTWQLVGVAVVVLLPAAAVSRESSVYVSELLLAVFIQIVNLATVVITVWNIPEDSLSWLRQRLDNLLNHHGRKDAIAGRGVDRFAAMAATWVLALSAGLSFFIYERHPHIPDEVVYLFHARYLAEGMLSVPAPPVPDAFSFYMIPYQEDRWYSIFPPGWPAILAIGVLLKAPWLVNPVLASLNVLLVYALLQQIYDSRTTRMVLLLLCTSPWFIFMAMNFMPHIFTLACSLFAALAVVRARKSGNAWWALVGGCAVGMVSLIRPLDGLVVAGLIGLWGIGTRSWRLPASVITTFMFGATFIGLLVLPYNWAVTGDPFVFPLVAYYENYFGPMSNALGFGPGRGLGWAIDPFPGHSFFEALINANLNFFSLNVELLGWSFGSLAMVGFFLFSGGMKKIDYGMLAVIAAICMAYSLYWFSGGPDFGARYWFLMVVPLLTLVARGAIHLERKVQSDPSASTDQGAQIILAVLILCVLSLINYLPWRATDKYYHYRGMRPDIRYLAEKYEFGKSLVLIQTDSSSDYLSAWTYNPLALGADGNEPVYAWDRNQQVRKKLFKAYPDRPVWIVNGPSITKDGFEVVQGPISIQELTLD